MSAPLSNESQRRGANVLNVMTTAGTRLSVVEIVRAEQSIWSGTAGDQSKMQLSSKRIQTARIFSVNNEALILSFLLLVLLILVARELVNICGMIVFIMICTLAI